MLNITEYLKSTKIGYCFCVVFLTILLSACGGGSGSSDEPQQTNEVNNAEETSDQANEASSDEAGDQTNEGSNDETGDDAISGSEGTEELDTPEVTDTLTQGAITKTQINLANNAQNAKEHAIFVSYLGSGKSIDGNPAEQIPFRTYMASCATETEEPRLFVSMTLDDKSADANPDSPRVGSVFEAKLNNETGALEPTGNQTILPMCNESHGIAVSDDCSVVGLVCATELLAPVSQSYTGDFIDLVTTLDNDASTVGDNVNNEHHKNDPANYEYNGEIWLFEWNATTGENINLEDDPDKYVIHKGYGGHYTGTADLIYNASDNSYATAFTTSVFDGSGNRHRSAATMIIERDSWALNPKDRGWSWACGNGHVFFISPFWNPYAYNNNTDTEGAYGTLCTSDANDWRLSNAGTMSIKYEDSNIFEGFSHYFMASSAGGVSKGGGHVVMPLDEDRTIGIMVAPDMHQWGEENFEAAIDEAEASALNFYGQDEVESRKLTGLNACNWYQDGLCLPNWARYEYTYDHGSNYPAFEYGFWYKDQMEQNDLSKIGIFHSDSKSFPGRPIPQADGDSMLWIAEDDDCMLGAPQLVDLKNGRFLVGYGKFQCISDGYKLRRFATNTGNTRNEATLIPAEYYLMEINGDGEVLTEPMLVSGSGWGSADKLVSLGEGKAAWAYIANPALAPDQDAPNASKNEWELLVYKSSEP